MCKCANVQMCKCANELWHLKSLQLFTMHTYTFHFSGDSMLHLIIEEKCMNIPYQLTASTTASTKVQKMLSQLLVSLTFALVAHQAMAVDAKSPLPTKSDTQSAVVVELTQFKVVKGADGKEQLQDAATVKPGDVLEYRATYTNKSKGTVKALVANLPIPEGLAYQAKSAKPGAKLVQAATKNGVFAAEPLMQKVPGKIVNGKAGPDKIVPVPYEEYRNLRWKLDKLPAGGVTEVSARAVVLAYTLPTNAPPAAGTAGAGGATP